MMVKVLPARRLAHHLERRLERRLARLLARLVHRGNVALVVEVVLAEAAEAEAAEAVAAVALAQAGHRLTTMDLACRYGMSLNPSSTYG